ncbi:MAG: acyl-CoA reductase [Saprospiraceae bacterium]|nr:acyl-CoA reductase [Saprospiraceae bacterium]
MTLSQRIESLVSLGQFLRIENNDELHAAVRQAESQNPWFTQENIFQALHAIADQFLQENKLRTFTQNYAVPAHNEIKKIALVLAGNIPLVGFHDVLCCYLAGHHAIMKYSEKDSILIPFLLDQLTSQRPQAAPYFTKVDKISGYDAAIVTGSDNTARHFSYYFQHIPHIIRKNRTSTVILTGNESEQSLQHLLDDIFGYFGLGCRNVSHMWIPENADITPLIEALNNRKGVMLHNKYKNNYDYNLALFLLNKEPFLQGENILLKESQQPASRIGCLHYARYTSLEVVGQWVETHIDQLQCIVSNEPIPGIATIPLGTSQCPAIDVFADGVDTMNFFVSLYP